MNITASEHTHGEFKKLDELAWRIIREWPAATDINLWKNGLNYHELSLWFFWDKIRGAVLQANHPELLKVEGLALLGRQSSPAERHAKAKKLFLSFFSRYLRSPSLRGTTSGHDDAVDLFQRKHEKVLFAPFATERLSKTIEHLLLDDVCQVVSRTSRLSVPGLDILGHNFSSPPDWHFADYFCKGAEKAFKKLGLTLPDQEWNLLKKQVADLTLTVGVAEQELGLIRPDAVLVHGDNHPPHQVYVMVARQMGVPSVMLQHGLDCERFYLDEAYASAIAVWGEERAARYREKSNWRPKIAVTGNPEFDNLGLPTAVNPTGSYWLWLTRPHTPAKCYAPSRSPKEGLEIMSALMSALAVHPKDKLVIKAHPYDYPELYEEMIAKSQLKGRVQLSGRHVHELLPRASLVVSEDTTAGMESMFWGKPLVQAHFSMSSPVMPMVEYGAALPGFSPEQLLESITTLRTLPMDVLQKFYAGQVRFLKDFAGPCDGKAASRLVTFIANILE